MKKVFILVLSVVLAISFSGCQLKINQEVNSSNSIVNEMLRYEEELHQKDFKIVSFSEGKESINTLFGYTTAEPDVLVLKYGVYEFTAEHCHNEPYDSENIWDNLVYVMEQDSISQDLEEAIFNRGYDSIVTVQTDTIRGFAGIDGKYQGCFDMGFYDSPTLNIYLFTDIDCFKFDSAKPVLRDIYSVFDELYGRVIECNIYFFDDTQWTKESMKRDMDMYEGASYYEDCMSHVYTVDMSEFDDYDAVFDAKEMSDRVEFIMGDL